jgi:hypothetical protein
MKLISQVKLDRRTALRGMLGGLTVAIGLPPLEAMLNSNGTAYGQGVSLPRRLGIFFWGNGVKLDRWTPSDQGPNWTPSPALEPLASVKEYVSVVSGMRIMTGNERGHHAGCVGILSGAPMLTQPNPNSNYVSTFTQPSIDQVAASAMGDLTRFRSLEVGISRRIITSEGTTLRYLSHNGPDSPNPPEYSARAVFGRIFGEGFVPPGAVAPVADLRRDLRRSILDAVMEDVNGLKRRVGQADKVRLEQHFENIRDIERRLANDGPRLVHADCSQPVEPPEVSDSGSQEEIARRTQLMSDLIAMALACDQTRVFSMMFTGSVGYTVFWQVGSSQGHHDLTHDEPGNQPLVHASTVFTMEQFATLLETLRSVQEGDGNLLDNTVILASSDVSDGYAHSISDYPILVAGGGGGTLKKPGVHYRSAGENTSKVLLTVLRSAGLDLDSFGTAGGHVTESCSEIEA